MNRLDHILGNTACRVPQEWQGRGSFLTICNIITMDKIRFTEKERKTLHAKWKHLILDHM